MNQIMKEYETSEIRLLKSNKNNNLKTAISTTNKQVDQKHHENCPCIRGFEEEINPCQFECMNCEQNLQKVATLKKNNIILQFNNAKLEEQVEKLKKQNANLKSKLSQKIKESLMQQFGSIKYLTIKEDLQAELFECKLMNQLLMIGQYPRQNQNQNIADRLEAAIIQKLGMQQQIEQMKRVINDTVLYPIYHYDSRIKSMRDIVVFLINKAQKECKRTQEQIKRLKAELYTAKKRVKYEINELMIQNQNCKQKQNIKISSNSHETIEASNKQFEESHGKTSQTKEMRTALNEMKTVIKKQQRQGEQQKKCMIKKSPKRRKQRENKTPKTVMKESRENRILRQCCIGIKQ